MQRVGPIQDKTYAQGRYRQRGRFEEFLGRHSSLLHFAKEKRSCHPSVELSTGLTWVEQRRRPAAGDSAAIPLLAAIFPLQLPLQFCCWPMPGIGLNPLKTRDNSADRVTFFPRLGGKFPGNSGIRIV
jgi:hypothetical protein